MLRLAPKRQVATLFSYMLLVNLTTGVGLLLILPMLDLLNAQRPSSGLAGALLRAFEVVDLPLSIVSILTVFAGLVMLRSLAQLAQERANVHLQNHIVDSLRIQCFEALLNVEWRWLIRNRRSDHANLLLSNISRIGVGLHFMIGLAVSLATIGSYLCVALLLSPSMTLLTMVIGGAVFLMLAHHRWRALRLGNDQTRASRALHNNVQEALSGIKLAKILGSENRFLSLFKQATDEFRLQQVAFVENTGVSKALFQIVSAMMLVAYVWLALSVWQVPPNEVLMLVVIFGRLVPMLMQAQQQFHQWIHALPAIDEAESLLANCRSHAEPDNISTAVPHAWIVKEGITLSGVNLSYEDRDEPALNDISLTLPSRSTTAIMGESGAGKSTLADILMGLIPPDTGTVFVDGCEIAGPVRRSWRSAVAYVPQDSFLFHDTIRTNLLWGNATATDAELQVALEKAAAQFVFALPQGLDTVVGDGGVRLSGGERQRIALARALLTKPALLILDEATSALDLANEARVREAVENLHGDITVVIIGHRLPMLEHADQVVELKAGRITAKGAWTDVRSSLNEPNLLEST